MSTELVKHQPSPATVARRMTIDEKINYAHQLSTAGLLPDAFRQNPGNVLWAVELGEALGIPTVTAINGVHVMKGKPTASAGLISALVRRAGHKLRVTGNAQSATAQVIRADDPDFVFEVTWTMEMARSAGLLSNGTWKSFPEAMLKSRAITQVARDACQEALNGVQYTPEELGAQVELDEAGEQVVVHQVTRVATPAVDWSAELEATDTVDGVRELWKRAAGAQADKLVLNAIIAKGKELAKVVEHDHQTPAQAAAEGVVDAEVVVEPVRPASPDAEAEAVIDSLYA